MLNEGWIKLFRKIEDNPVICKDNDYFRVWCHLLLNATHKSMYVFFNGNKILLQPGQYITGRKQIANKCKISESKAERILKMLEIEQQIEQRKFSVGRLITVLNWEMYQESEQQNEQRVNNEWTTSEQRVNTKQEYKECKNIYKNNKKENIKEKETDKNSEVEEILDYDWIREKG